MYTIILFGRTMVNQKVEESVLKSKLMAGRTKLRVVRVLQLQQHRRIGLWAQAERACLACAFVPVRHHLPHHRIESLD